MCMTASGEGATPPIVGAVTADVKKRPAAGIGLGTHAYIVTRLESLKDGGVWRSMTEIWSHNFAPNRNKPLRQQTAGARRMGTTIALEKGS
jgi:hypothetical protein